MKRGFEIVGEIISKRASEGLEKSLARAVYKQEKEETKAKSVLVDLKMPKLEEIFKTAVIATKRLTVLKIKKKRRSRHRK